MPLDSITLDYGRPKPRVSRARIFAIAATIVAALWCIAFFLLFALVGEPWITPWFWLNLPLSGIVEDHLAVGPDSYGWITAITVANGVTLGLVVGFFASLIAAARRGR